MGMSKHVVLRQAARLYIEVMRGVPIIVLLLYVAFVLVPGVVAGVDALIGEDVLRTRDVPLLWRAVLALMLAYSAFLAEIFRAGLQAVDKGQIEAAQALGLNGWQRFRHVRFPQAFRLILPPLGNDFVGNGERQLACRSAGNLGRGAAGESHGGGELSVFRDL